MVEKKGLIGKLEIGDSIVLKTSPEQYANEMGFPLPEYIRASFEGLEKDNLNHSEEFEPRFCFTYGGLRIHSIRFSYSEIVEVNLKDKIVTVAPYPDVYIFTVENTLPLSGGKKHQRRSYLLNSIKLNSN
ncbi:hypothetical protein COU54_01650 [Candidatus Pacearchaeota archaeon CG10_big_fil_rev_8_21_14_0_10_31_24]|nr:MAG: hypothetical protein COU54_01650 [Candidatus Pacearchaeota archaeon CG10_big_fil_rev_8_21_14_0_10_31_24]